MAFMLHRKVAIFRSIVISPFPLGLCCFTHRASSISEAAEPSLLRNKETPSGSGEIFRLSPLFMNNETHTNLQDCRIDLVDEENWQVSSGLAQVWKSTSNQRLERNALVGGEDEFDDRLVNCVPQNENEPDFDEIEEMRVRGNLFYKLDRDSREYEEYNFDFHRRKSSKNKGESKQKPKKEKSLTSGIEKATKNKDQHKENKEEKRARNNVLVKPEMLPGRCSSEHLVSEIGEFGGSSMGKEVRVPTFNQLTAPYHEPFCLDIHVTKGSARASVIHRATSKVVAVAHSISKDFKFDLGSPKSRDACAVVGEVLAQRALADDIHNVVYTPRKEEKLEGKLQIVLQAIVDNGVYVKVKLKQRKNKKAGLHHRSARERE